MKSTADGTGGTSTPEATMSGGGRRRGYFNRPKPATFVGTVKELEGFIFDMVGGSRQALMYERTVERITLYIGNEFKEGGDLIKSIENNLSDPIFVIPPDLPATASQGEKRLFEKECDEIFDRKKRYRTNNERLYSVVWGQCAENSRAELESSDDFEDVSRKLDGLGLLRILRSVMQNYQDKKYGPLASFQVKRQFFGYRQHENQSTRDYYEGFKSMARVLETIQATVGPDPGTVKLVAKPETVCQ
jgi:hypothetical protein